MSELIVKTRYGMVEGIREGEISIWKGIPYAKPPIQSLRFRPPQEPDSWDGVREAKKFGPAAIQPESPSMKFLGDSPNHKSEDCLYLNIWSPGADNKRRPVMVWIHGGSFTFGSGSSRLYDGKFFAEKGDVVVVTINYRLGVFGFLHLEDIGGETYRGSGNCALLDQVAALKWVNDNIEAFGGDPNNITIFGESAGAVCVGNLLSMKSAKGLFHKAILQSGTARSNVPRENATQMTEQLLKELQVEPDNLTKLEDIPAETILNALTIFPRAAFGPVGDNTVLPARPELAIYEGFAKDIPVIVGTTKDEWRLFTHFDPMWKDPIDEDALKKLFELILGPFWANISKYVIQGDSFSRAVYEDVMTHFVFTYPAIFCAESQAKNAAPVWMYRFDYQSNALDGEYSAYHALEIPFVWNTIQHPEVDQVTGNDPNRYQLAEQMHQAWFAFAHHGDPNTDGLPDWPKYDLEKRSTIIFNSKTEVLNDPDRQKRLNWEQVVK